MALNESIATLIRQNDGWLEQSSAAFKPLKEPGNEIRLMRIQNCEYEDGDIHVSLSIAKLDQNPLFYALSLAWGSTADSKTIYLQGHKYQVTYSQYDALQNIRRRQSYKDAYLWMDAICINQIDTAERSLMVSMMHRIYGASMFTLIWLGEPNASWVGQVDENASQTMIDVTRYEATTDSSYDEFYGLCGEEKWLEAAFWVLHRIAKGVHFSEFPVIEKDGKGAPSFRSHWAMAVSTLGKILSQPWWSRVWVMQEAILSPRVPEVHIGRHTLPLKSFLDASDAIHLHSYSCCSRVFDPYLRKLSAGFNLAEGLRLGRERVGGAAHFSLRIATALTEQREATDPRDRVYGVVGLLPEAQRVTVDYTLTKFQVYANAQWAIIRHLRSLTCIFQTMPSMNHDREKPSWCQDWSQKPAGRPIRWPEARVKGLRAAERIRLHHISCDVKAKTLTLPCWRLDTIVDIEPVNFKKRPSGETLQRCNDFLRTVPRLRKFVLSKLPQTSNTVFWETISRGNILNPRWKGGHINGGDGNNDYNEENEEEGGGQATAELERFICKHPFPTETCEKLEEILAWLEAAPRKDTDTLKKDDYLEVLSIVRFALKDSSVLITEGGHIGLGDRFARRGDGIYHLYGCSTPVILRPWSTDGYIESMDEPPHAVIAGFCYVSDFIGTAPSAGASSWKVTLH